MGGRRQVAVCAAEGKLRSRILSIRTVLVAGDVTVLAGAWAVASFVRFGSVNLPRWRELVPDFPVVAAAYALLVVAAMARGGLYRLRARWSIRAEAIDLAHAIGFLFVLTLAALFVFRLEDVSRLFLVLFFTLLLVGTLISRVVVRRLLIRRRESGRGTRHVVIVGSGLQAEAFTREITARVALAVNVVGFVNEDGFAPEGHRWLGSISTLHEVFRDHVVHEVVVCLQMDKMALIDVIAETCRDQGKDVRIPMQFAGHTLAEGRFESVEGLHVLSLTYSPSSSLSIWGKRFFDIVGAVLLLVLLAPAIVGGALAVGLSDGRPILFKQVRGGYHGKPFKLLKLRTMVHDAELHLHGLLDRNERSGPVFKMGDDPRVTQVGRVLRRTSIDELPQLFNVLKGDMSLVGPRPAIPQEIDQYDIWHRRRLSMKPGITGLWQVTARNDPNFDSWVELDLSYIDNWSMWEDLKLLARTPAAVLRRTGK